MPNQLEVYKCTHCGNIVEVLHGGGAGLVCCGENMKLMKEGSTDGAMEKHVPVIEKIEGGYKVTVGSVAHPMDENHYIEWIELLADNQSLTCFLKPGDKPEAVFKTDAEKVTAREYCNLHGHWKAENYAHKERHHEIRLQRVRLRIRSRRKRQRALRPAA